jgi:hypothetical protein
VVGGPALTRRAALLGMLGALLVPLRARGTGDHVVLIIGAASPVTALDVVDVRRIFLGIPVMHDGVMLTAIRNESDPVLQQVFLQNIVSMSPSAYERRLLVLSLEQGRRPPPVYADLNRLLAAVAGDTRIVSYAWASSIVHHARLRVLRPLWTA